MTSSPASLVRGLGLAAGVLMLAIVLVVPPPEGLSDAGWRTLGLGLAMAVWWSTEPVPIGVTALIPVLILPLIGVGTLAEASAPYGNPLVFLFLGGFLLAAAVEHHGLHRRIAGFVLTRAGASPRRLVAGFLLTSGFLSMWISNTATVVLLLPVALSVLQGPAAHRALSVPVLLAVAYGASIGGTATLIGTPPNAMTAAWLAQTQGIEIGFGRWAALAMPFVLLFLALGWRVLVHRLPPGEALEIEDPALGPATPAERRVAVLFALAAGLWVLRPLLNALPGLAALSDTGIALAVGAALFLVPQGGGGQGALLHWAKARGLPWDVLLLFGGGLSLAAAMESSGLAAWVGLGLAGLGDWPALAILLAVTASVIALSEMLSNTALVAALLPVVGAIAEGTGLPVAHLAAAVALAASCTFMLPAGTPPNSLVFSSGLIRVAQMMRYGLVMNLLSTLLVALLVWLWAPVVF